ncbi:MAG: hypothetical protein ABI683_15865 [Ginsengibacter sp.]
MREKLILTGRIVFAIAIAGVGFQQFYDADFHPMILPPLHEWIPFKAFWAYVTGIAFFVFAGCVVFQKKGRTASLILGGVLLAIFCLYYIPYEIIVDPYYKHLGSWGNAEKELALAGGVFVIAGSFAIQGEKVHNKFSWLRTLEKLISLGGIFFSITMISFGVDHLLYTEGISTLVPSWIPGKIFWTYFAAVALIGSGISIVFKIWVKIIATLLGTMIFLWFIFLHIPRAVEMPFAETGNEVTSAFSALAFSGIAFVIAGCHSKTKSIIS